MPGKLESTDINAVIFDMDGLILDTEPISLATFVQACREHSFEPDLSVYHRCIGVNWEGIQRIIREGYGPTFPFDAVTGLWRRNYNLQTQEGPVPIKAGALNLLKYLAEERTRMVLVTSTRSEMARRELFNTGLADFFDFILGGDQVTRSKPDPEIYLTACEKLGEHPAKCLALEDSDNGVKAAFHAGLKVIQIPDMIQPSAEVKALGHVIMESLTAVEEMLRAN